jgi:hypothetical protein
MLDCIEKQANACASNLTYMTGSLRNALHAVRGLQRELKKELIIVDDDNITAIYECLQGFGKKHIRSCYQSNTLINHSIQQLTPTSIDHHRDARIYRQMPSVKRRT